jgi:AbrB family looped-hinge helix DNA binding protein
MGKARISNKFTVTIPKDVRESFNLKIADTLLFTVEENKIVFTKYDKVKLLNEVFGLWKNSSVSAIDEVDKLREEWNVREKRIRK